MRATWRTSSSTPTPKLGGIILNQPSGIVFQIFDAKGHRPARGPLQTGTPIVAYPVTGGITFTFGGVRIPTVSG
jgi:hypothetical protein